MKKKLIATGLFLSMFALLTAEVMDDNGRAGATGAPGETTCNTSNCHNSFGLNSDLAGSIQLRTGTVNNEYVPGQVYNMEFKVARPGTPLFGLGVEALDAAGNNAGTLTITQPANTLIKTRTIGIVNRRSVTHTFNGGLSNDSMVFRFSWTAPASGTVTFYYCGNAANANGSVSGDYIYSGSTVLTPASSTGIRPTDSPLTMDVSPNPVQNRCSIRLFNTQGAVSLELFEVTGKLVKSETTEASTVEWNDMNLLPRGTYLLRLRQTDGTGLVKRIVLQ
ncbi:MAG: hypothetical protein RL021_513 [Bacteroidota bacterium]|jgi:hypothetical protein